MRAVPIGGHHARILEGFGKLDTPAGGPGYHVAVSFAAPLPGNLPPGFLNNILNPRQRCCWLTM